MLLLCGSPQGMSAGRTARRRVLGAIVKEPSAPRGGPGTYSKVALTIAQSFSRSRSASVCGSAMKSVSLSTLGRLIRDPWGSDLRHALLQLDLGRQHGDQRRRDGHAAAVHHDLARAALEGDL